MKKERLNAAHSPQFAFTIMASGHSKRKRTDRVSLKLPPGTFGKLVGKVRSVETLLRIGLCLLAAIVLWLVTGLWYPPFPYRAGDIPQRNIVARVSFETKDEAGTLQALQAAKGRVDAVYAHDRQLLMDKRRQLRDKIFQVLQAQDLDDLDAKLWAEFSSEPQPEQETAELVNQTVYQSMAATWGGANPIPVSLPTALISRYGEFDQFRQALADDVELKTFDTSLQRCMVDIDRHGLLDRLRHQIGEDGNSIRISVYAVGTPELAQSFDADSLRLIQAKRTLAESIRKEFPSTVLAESVIRWLDRNLEKTLTFDPQLTRQKQDAIQVEPRMIQLKSGESVLAEAGEPLDNKLTLLREEHTAYIDSLSGVRLLYFSLCKLGMYAALYVLCGVYIYYRRRSVLQDLTGLSRLILLVTVTVAATWFSLKTRFELVPLLLFAMTAVIVYQQEIALLLSASVALVTVLSGGLGILELVTLSAAMSVVVLMIRHIRTRTKLIYVGLWTAAAVISTTIGVGTFLGRNPSFILLQEAAWYAACAVGAGVLMTGLLPFVEKFFDVQTDLSLLELGDVAHPLLQELVRRAPGTYNHSINVASIAQAAAESIGANGLLVRVGAYFHDIGKMLKPQYFVENQSGDNRHESLMPAMSTLVIIAHVKDGADLARQHNLPNTLVDFILQHHGTTLVEYFYHRANEKQRESDPDAELVDEGHYRYPGPKPQTKEAAVLMLADTVESASRSLVDPAPARIESLVEDMAMKKLMDGQFDECGLTLKELRTIQDSLIKSLTAVYHGRIKYPDQQTA